MDPINNNQSPIEQTPEKQQEINTPIHNKIGPIVAILVIILILIIGALYMFASNMNNRIIPTNTTAQDGSIQQNQPTQVQPVTNTSDDVGSLEADLNTSIQGIDSQNF